ncbi:E3 ubiquitin-protein ligase SINA-like 10 [Triticum dicoccoides]|uniref:RING-type E3 ubiquitin transferase n=1 Tax=Triticum turgidum subsp. durum TaxID=4567 RepID=A0A9R1RW20_TRITD|nr:E3 ubiquitin-protein ligase SINA-like 10 [Triticum dicoccoides]VAH71262.1 unnamed protein product [Triticum turgidum subsp. durum]
MHGAGPAADGRSRASPDKAAESTKKARLDLPDGHVKVDMARGGDGCAIVAAYGPREELAVRIDKRLLHCLLCTVPFKAPVFQCKAGHLACGDCVAKLPFGQCKACVDGGGFFDPCPALDAVVSSTRIVCPNAGCQRYVTYHEVAEHQTACPHTPCRCTEPGCGYIGAPQALAGHLHTVHLVPMRAVQYGKVIQLQLPVSTPRVVLLGDDNRVFLLIVGALGAGVTAVSMVCARARAVACPRFMCKMWVNLEPPSAAVVNGGRADFVLVEMHMRSSSSPGAVVVADEPTFLSVPRMYLVPAAGIGGDGAASLQVPLHIRIDKLSPWSDQIRI